MTITMTDNTQAPKSRTAMSTGMVALRLSVAVLLLAATLSEVPGAAAASYPMRENDPESKMQQALSYYASKSPSLLHRALQEGGMEAEVGPDGSVVDELWGAEFALEALEREMRMLNELRGGGEDEDDDSEDDSQDDSDDEEYESGDDDYDEFGEDDSDDEEYNSKDEGDSEDDPEYGNYDALGEVFIYDDGVTMEQYLAQDKELKALLDAIPDEDRRIDVYEDTRDQALMKDDLDPDLWYQYSYWELHAYFSCHRTFAGPMPIPDDAKWRRLRDHWNTFRERDAEMYPVLEGETERMFQFTTGSFEPPLVPFHAENRGRGLKAARDIAAGELVFKATNNTVIFTNGHTWRKFLFSIYEWDGEPYDSQTACDVLVWSWVQPIEERGPLVIVADLDNGSLLNEGRANEDGWDMPNVRCGQVGDKMCMMSYYAMTDIKEGEELLTDYREFALLHSWPQMGL